MYFIHFTMDEKNKMENYKQEMLGLALTVALSFTGCAGLESKVKQLSMLPAKTVVQPPAYRVSYMAPAKKLSPEDFRDSPEVYESLMEVDLLEKESKEDFKQVDTVINEWRNTPRIKLPDYMKSPEEENGK